MEVDRAKRPKETSQDEETEPTQTPAPEPAQQPAEENKRNFTGQRTRNGAPTGKESLKIIYLNARSLLNKIDHLSLMITDHAPDIVLISETWLNSDINNAMLNIEG